MFSVLYETVTGFSFVLPWMLSQCCRIGSNTVTLSVEQLYNLSELLNHTFKVRNIVNITSVILHVRVDSPTISESGCE